MLIVYFGKLASFSLILRTTDLCRRFMHVFPFACRTGQAYSDYPEIISMQGLTIRCIISQTLSSNMTETFETYRSAFWMCSYSSMTDSCSSVSTDPGRNFLM